MKKEAVFALSFWPTMVLAWLVVCSIGCAGPRLVEYPNDGVVDKIVTQRVDFTDQECRSKFSENATLDDGKPLTAWIMIVGCWIASERTIYLSFGYDRREHEYCHALGRPKEECHKIKN